MDNFKVIQPICGEKMLVQIASQILSIKYEHEKQSPNKS